MNVFKLRDRLVSDYQRYTQSFIKISDPRISEFVNNRLNAGTLWPEPLLQLNPNFQSGGTIDDLVRQGVLHSDCERIFRFDKSDAAPLGKQLFLHEHQRQAIILAKSHKSYVLTSGTGSGKSLTYIVPIVDHVLRHGSGHGIQAIIVYPMNALVNSQDEELRKFLEKGFADGKPPVRFARFTGQRGEDHTLIRSDPPDILLTNYMMLELMLTRWEDIDLVRAAQGLNYLVFDELHTYRGRQGADIALLIRRCRNAFAANDLVCIGTSATMASDGTVADQRQEVAKVATTLFGTPVAPEQVIGETLERATPEINIYSGDALEALRQTINSEAPPPEKYEDFRLHPLSSWIESVFGVRKEKGSEEYIRQMPRRLQGDEIEGQKSAAQELADLTGQPPERCSEVLRQFLLHGSQLHRNESSRLPIFAFRLHQFFTRGDTVWTTLESESQRHLEISKKVTQPGAPDKPLYPLVFCRHCGAAYYRVSVVADGGKRKLLAREDRREDQDEESENAYLYISSESPWPRQKGAELLDRLPEFMKETIDGQTRIRPESVGDVPEAVFVNPTGQIVREGEGLPAALIRNKFLFCLEPSCGVAYTKIQRSERNKLSTLGVDSRSTATTILAVRSLIELQHDRELEKEARKLLSFTDNRQDASLQAGHFNDFVQVSLLRSALFKAVQSKGAEGLGHGELARSVFAAMELPFEEYAADSDIRGPAREVTHDALRRVIHYHLYRDLQRGWRVTAPNLEDCGLLNFDYVGLRGEECLLADKELWEKGISIQKGRGEKHFAETPEALQACPDESRHDILVTLLDVMRRSLAIKVDVLDAAKQQELVEQTKPRLLEDTVWYLEDARDLAKADVAYPRPKRRNERSGLFISSHGSFGRYLKRTLFQHLPQGRTLKGDEVDRNIQFLLLALKMYGIVEQVRGGSQAEEPGYQINVDAIRWMAGDGVVRPVDRTRLLEAGEVPPEVNQYFVECYRSFVDLKCLFEAREHTAQVGSLEREDREVRFRSGDLPLLFCSPTMELGVDIAQLNLVNLRNVPPTPANYAQRSGRAGRGGQPALVFTYCAGRSPHDQYFYRQPGSMVSGTVRPPRIDLRNHNLVRSHVHAVWMEVSRVDLGKTLVSVIDLNHPDDWKLLPVKNEILRELRNPAHRASAMVRAKKLLDSIHEHLQGATWYHEHWLEEVFDQLERSFDSACDRWRNLYRTAKQQRELHHRIMGEHQTRSESETNISRRLRAQAEAQITLLTSAAGIYEGDFYSYRYFAAEGFLPGYNFPRLPLSAFVPKQRRHKGQDEYISRPRFLAISEFGPDNLIYHEGARYRVSKVNLEFNSTDGDNAQDLMTLIMKRCSKCGYAHMEQGRNLAEVCDRCGAPLDGSSVIENLIQLQNVSLQLAKRITCDEEERQRRGYKLISSYRFPEFGGCQDRKDAEVYCNNELVMRLSYGDATDLYRINLGWGTQKDTTPPGFLLDIERGYWGRKSSETVDHDEAVGPARTRRVVPFVRDTKNALVMRFDAARSISEMAGLQSAFKQAIQHHFQLEPRELACEPMPSSLDRRELLFYEVSEGGAGVLRQLVEDPAVVPLLARKALEICHYDPQTLRDLAAERCGKACYECLLEYGNQMDHKDIDRGLIRGLLSDLAKAECRPAGGIGTRVDRMADLRKRCDSKLEQRWLDMVDVNMLRPPSHGQYRVPGLYTDADFFYREPNATIYIDGPPHDEPEQMRKDEEINQRLLEAGYIVIRFHHRQDWEAIFRKHPDIFGAFPK